MRGKGHRRKLSKVVDPTDSYKVGTDERSIPRKGKKKGKNWRFAYDLYCKEIITSNQAQLNSHRSNEKNAGN